MNDGYIIFRMGCRLVQCIRDDGRFAPGSDLVQYQVGSGFLCIKITNNKLDVLDLIDCDEFGNMPSDVLIDEKVPVDIEHMHLDEAFIRGYSFSLVNEPDKLILVNESFDPIEPVVELSFDLVVCTVKIASGQITSLEYPKQLALS